MSLPVIALPSGIDISYELHGLAGGMPIVLVHGHASRGGTYDEFLQFLGDEFLSLTFDLRGHGESGKPEGTNYQETLQLYTVEQFARDLHELVVEIAFPTPFVLAGHSLGGMIAQQFTLQHASLVSHLILCGTAPSWYSDGRATMLACFKDGSMVLDEKFFHASIAMTLTRAFRKAHPEVIANSLQSRLLVPRDVYIATMENIVFHFDVRDQLNQINVPTLVMTGESDAVVQPGLSRELHDLIPGSTLIHIPGQNHGIFHEVPDFLASQIKRFVLGIE
ncbi:MAG TPA: alpha/beta fold hydrolase [Candidatus Lokiarchaeia archaeon]|nr:alpha/beta fold hydrolase [Candidatus Lokiarchaeia archaeon]